MVLEGYSAIGPTKNPYITQLDAALRSIDGLEVLTFSPGRALAGRYDLLHLHWPENLFGGHTRRGRAARRFITTLVLLRLTVTRTPIVRTTHNLHRPSGLGRYDNRLLDWIDRLTKVQIRLNDDTALPLGRVTHTIPHGHYRDWYRRFERATAIPRRLCYIGLIRRYKGVEDLLEAFSAVDVAGVTLKVTGKPSTVDLATGISAAAAKDPRVSVRLEFVDDAEFVAEVSRSSLVVMPYRHMHNSGVALAALSLERPVLVPDTPVNRALAAEVGEGWVHVFSRGITAADLTAVLAQLERHPPSGAPELSARDWSQAGPAHLTAYRDALGRFSR